MANNSTESRLLNMNVALRRRIIPFDGMGSFQMVIWIMRKPAIYWNYQSQLAMIRAILTALNFKIRDFNQMMKSLRRTNIERVEISQFHSKRSLSPNPLLTLILGWTHQSLDLDRERNAWRLSRWYINLTPDQWIQVVQTHDPILTS